MAFLGNIGQLVSIKCATQLDRETVRPSRARTTLGGQKTVQVGARTSRSWLARLGATSGPDDYSAVQAFIEGEHGLGPWWYVSDWAAVSNVLPPRASVLDSDVDQPGVTVNGGSVALPDGGVAGRSWVVSPTATISLPWVSGVEYVPVIPGRRLTASVYAQGDTARLRIRFYRVDGTITRTVGDALTEGSGLERISLSATPLADEVKMLLLVDSGATRIARPAVTWTDTVQPWAVGEGAEKVHLSELSISPVLALPEGAYTSASFTIQEVG